MLQLEQINWSNNFPLGLIMTTVREAALFFSLLWLLLDVAELPHKDDTTEPSLVFCLNGMAVWNGEVY